MVVDNMFLVLFMNCLMIVFVCLLLVNFERMFIVRKMVDIFGKY